jgi:uncharacterized membrane protein SpoIIM required for sporulation
MSYCPDCGTPLIIGQNFCRNCGLDIRERQTEAVPGTPAAPAPRGLGRNVLVFPTQEGLAGVRFLSDGPLFAAFLLPLPLFAAAYSLTLGGSLAVYATLWLVLSALLYDELRWRGLRRFRDYSPEAPGPAKSWLVRWSSIRMADWNGRTLWFTSSDPSLKASVTFDEKDATAVERSLASWGVRYNWRRPTLPRQITRFWTLALLLFIASQAILILAATLPFFPGEYQVYSNIFTNTQSHISGTTLLGEFQTIYLNNIQVAWGGAVPFIGALFSGVASYNTGRVVQVIAIGNHIPSAFVLLSLYVFPHTWVEEFSYPMATAAGLLAVTRWRSVAPEAFARRLNRGSTKLLLALVGVALTLMLAGVLETLISVMGYAVILLWAPTGAGYYLLAKWNRKRGRDAPAIGRP